MPEVINPTSPAVITLDVPCVGCRYDLRGLRADGRCPECGMEIAQSLWVCRRWQHRRAHRQELLSAADPKWLRQLCVGAAISVLVLLLMLATSFAPRWAYAWKSPQKRVMLGITCTSWVLSVYAAWKIAAPEPLKDREGKPSSLARFPILPSHGARRPLRICTAFYMWLPFVVNGNVPGLVVVATMVPLLMTGVAAAWLYWHYVSHLVWRLGTREVAIPAKLFGVLNVLAFILSLMPARHSPDSVDQIMSLPTVAYGSPGMLMDLIRWSVDPECAIFVLYLAAILWALFVSSWLLVHLIRAAGASQCRAEALSGA